MVLKVDGAKSKIFESYCHKDIGGAKKKITMRKIIKFENIYKENATN